jgi:hypothetical protein
MTNQEIRNSERAGKVLTCLCLTLLLIGFSQGTVQAQTKLIPTGGPTLKITKGGSYFLGSSIKSTLTSAPVILVTVNNVTIDLRGFTIVGPGGTAGTSTGISASAGVTGLTILNGSITKIRGTGVSLGNSSTVIGLEVFGNAGDGIDCATACLVTNNIITGNLGTGMSFGDTTSGYQNNIISGNGGTVSGGTQMGSNVCNGSSTCP